MVQWTPGQVHDTVAAIASQAAYVGQQRSLFVRFFRFVLARINDLLDFVRGSLDARIVIAVAVLAIVVIIAARVAIDRRAAERRRARGTRARGADGRRNPWTESREHASAGRFVDACHALYAAILDDLTAAGLVRYHRSKTAGDYVRDLGRSRAAIAPDLRAFVRDFERAVFGPGDVTRADYERLTARAEQIVATIRRPAAA
jgi:hypothetical protein